MFSTLRNRFGIPGVISVIALVFAMIGGAYAANNSGDGKGATASAKKSAKGPRGPRGPKGATGATGPAGQAGAPGANGKDGAAGPAGPTGPTGSQGPAGATGSQGPAGTAGATGSQGPAGDPWTVGGTLPDGKTLTGTFGVGPFNGEASSMIAFSFPLPLESAPGYTVVKEDGTSVWSGGNIANCPGTAAKPTALPGNLCIYTKDENGEPVSFTGQEVTKYGAVRTAVFGEFNVQGRIHGTWAVTAPNIP